MGVLLMCEGENSSSVSVFMFAQEEGQRILFLLSHPPYGDCSLHTSSSLSRFVRYSFLSPPLSRSLHLSFNMKAFIDAVNPLTCVTTTRKEDKPAQPMHV